PHLLAIRCTYASLHPPLQPPLPTRRSSDLCTNTSLPPPSRTIKPKPLVALYHLTVPFSDEVGSSAGRSLGRKPPVRGLAGVAVLLSTLSASVTCGPRWPCEMRTSSVSPGCTSMTPRRPRTEACRNASPEPSDSSTKPKPFSDLNHLTTA